MPPMTRCGPSTRVASIYVIAACVAVTAYLASAFVLALAFPYHDWDAFALGSWSISIAHGHLDPIDGGAVGDARPLFFWLQGALWSVTGVSFAAGRLLGLGFAAALLVGAWLFTRAVFGSALEAALAVIVVVAIPAFTQDAIEGMTDVPAAAAVAIVGWLALRSSHNRRATLLVGLAAFVAVLVKQTVFFPLGALALFVFFAGRRRSASLGICGGLAVGAVYEWVTALRFHLGLLTYLRNGTTDGLYAQLAARARWDAVLRADVFGQALRLPLTFGLLYGAARVLGVRHRVAALVALPLSLVWSIAGPYAAHVTNGPFATAESAFTLVGFAALLSAVPMVRDEEAPSRKRIVLGFAFGLPPLLLWVDSVVYANRLASASWPGLALLIALVLATGVRGLRAMGTPAALAPIPVLAIAVWMSLAGIDGLHGYDWVEVRQLGWHGLWNRRATMNIVLPSVQSALTTATPALGDHGTLVTDDPSFQYFLPPGRVRRTFALHCGDVAGSRVFIFLTSDEVSYVASHANGLVTPSQWARCTNPKLTQLTDGADGYVVFAVAPPAAESRPGASR